LLNPLFSELTTLVLQEGRPSNLYQPSWPWLDRQSAWRPVISDSGRTAKYKAVVSVAGANL
jgi:hypothetical protein